MLLLSRSIPRSPRTKQAVCLARCLVKGKVTIIQQRKWAASDESPTAAARFPCVKLQRAPTLLPRSHMRRHAAPQHHNHTLRRPRPLGQCIRSTAFIPAAWKSCPRSRTSTCAPTTFAPDLGCIRSANTVALMASLAASCSTRSYGTGKTDLRVRGGQVRVLRTLQARKRGAGKRDLNRPCSTNISLRVSSLATSSRFQPRVVLQLDIQWSARPGSTSL